MLLLPITREDLLKYLPKGGTVAEIGVLQGDFSKLILKHAAPARLHLIDPWVHQDREDYAHDPANRVDAEHDRLFRKVQKTFGRRIKKGEVTLHRDFSTNVTPSFDDGYFDWVYIDGLHTREGVANDLGQFDPKLKEGGLILGHDFTNQDNAREMNFGVVEAVEEFVGRTAYEFLAMTLEMFPTFLLAKDGQSELVAAMIERLILDIPGVVEIRDYPGRTYRHKTYTLEGRRGRAKTRVVPSF
jgi:hypothetical protein